MTIEVFSYGEGEPIGVNGLPVTPSAIAQDGNDLIAVLPDDWVVKLIGWTGVSAGTQEGIDPGGEPQSFWDCTPVRYGRPGLYNLVAAFPKAVQTIQTERLAGGKRIKRWEASAVGLCAEVLENHEVAANVAAKGWHTALRTLR